MGRTLFVAGLVAVTVLALLVLRDRTRPGPPDALRAGPAVDPAAPDAAPVAGRAGAERSRADRPAEPVPGAPSTGDGEAAPAAAAPDELPAEVVLEGAAIRVRAGVEHAADDGAFRLGWRRAGAFEQRRVDVTHGSWRVSVPPDVRLRVSDLELAGAVIQLDEDEYAVPADRFLVLRGAERRGVLLHVLSAATRRPLEDVEVWPGPYAFPTGTRHPGAEPEGAPVARGASPVRIPPRLGTWRSAAQYFVRAPGHAWGSVDVDHAAGGEREVLLDPAASLEVELVGGADWLAPEVRLWPPDANAWDAYAYAQRAPDASGRAVFESLAPGAYVASVERGWADRRVSYGRADVQLVAGERAHVPIQVELPERPRPVRVAGTLTVPDAWGDLRLALEVGAEGGEASVWMDGERAWPLAGFEVLDGAPPGSTRRAFAVELPIAGTYHLELAPLPVRRLLEVPEEGLAGLDVVVPPPALVVVRVVDAATGEELTVDTLQWSAARVEGIRATTLHEAVRDPSLGRVAFRVPAGQVDLSTKDPSLQPVPESASYTVGPGTNEVTLRVWRQTGVRFTFRDGEAEVPWDWSWRLSAHRRDGQARDVARSIGILWFREPGTYELRSAGIPGYQSIDGTPIHVPESGGLVDVEVHLVRE